MVNTEHPACDACGRPAIHHTYRDAHLRRLCEECIEDDMEFNPAELKNEHREIHKRVKSQPELYQTWEHEIDGMDGYRAVWFKRLKYRDQFDATHPTVLRASIYDDKGRVFFDTMNWLPEKAATKRYQKAAEELQEYAQAVTRGK